MRNIDLVVRIVLGIVLLFFGLNGIFHFMTPPASTNEDEIKLFMALANAGYFFNIITIVFLFSAIAFIFNKLVLVGLLLLSPILVNILLIHLRYSPEGIVFGAFISVLMLILYWLRRDSFLPLLKF
jgi:hypothetical protein